MNRAIILLILLIFTASQALALFGSSKSAYQDEVEKRAKLIEKKKVKREKELAKQEAARLKAEKAEAKKIEKELKAIEKEQAKQKKELAKLEEKAKKKQEKEKLKAQKSIKLSEKQISDIDAHREALRANEEKALEFIFPSLDGEEFDQISRENFFSKTEKEQLLELWRATIARNRTIQFIIKSLSANPDEVEKNNAVTQVLSRALFVPFYAVSAVANNSLVSGGSAVGARVIGDVVDTNKEKRDRNKQITRTDMIVLFMLVDEVAERLRTAYYAYKEAKVEKELISFELKPARLDSAEALEQESGSSVFFTRMVVRDLERRLRTANLNYMSNRRTLVELAGEDAVDSVDVLISLEVEEMMSDIAGV